MNIILSITAPVFLIIALGYLCARKKLIPAEAQKPFSLYVFYYAMPFYLFLAMAKVPHDTIVNFKYIAAFALSMFVVAAIAGFITKRIYRRNFPSCILAMMGSCYTNSAFVGIPIIVMAYGNAAPVIVITLFQVIVVTTIILTTIEIRQKHGLLSVKALREFPKTVLLNPIVGGSLLGIIFAWQGWQVPVLVERAGSLLGGAGIPTALFALGLSLADRKPFTHASSRKLVYLLTGLKVAVHPLFAYCAGRYLFGLSDPWLGSLTIVAAMPTAVNNFVFAQRYESFVSESSQTVFLSSVISLFTLSSLLWLFGIGQ
jgi:predicted permease